MRHKITGIKKKKFIAALAAVLALSCATRANAAEAALLNVSGALFADAGTHYEIKAESGGGTVTMSIMADGAPEGAELFFNSSVEKSDCIASIFPTRSVVRSGIPSMLSVELRPNLASEEVFGEITLRFEYENSSEEPPEPLSIIIAQRGAAAAQEPEPQTSGEELAVIAMLESAVQMPEVLFSGNQATLTYSPASAVSWGGGAPDATLTIRNVSILEPDTPLAIDGYQPMTGAGLSRNKYNVMLPAEQINYILGKRADEIVSSLPEEIVLIEDTSRSDTVFSYLVPSFGVNLPEGTSLLSDSAYVIIPNGEIMGLAAQTEWLASQAGQDVDVFVSVLFNGAPASSLTRLTIKLSRPDLYPSAMGLIESEIISGAESEPPPAQPVEQTEASSAAKASENGLAQSYDSRRKHFRQSFTEDIFFTSSIPNGLVTNDDVTFTIPKGIEYTLYRDDERVIYVDSSAIREPGCYRLVLTAEEAIPVETDIVLSEITLDEIAEINDMELSELLEKQENIVKHNGEFRFRIVRGATSGLVFFNPPPGYKITELTYNEVKVSNYSPYSVRLSHDGIYRFSMAGRPGEPEFSTEVARYTASPTITLSGVEKGMSSTKPVSFEGFAADGTRLSNIEVQFNNAVVTGTGGTVSAPGVYRITATDAAGNSCSADFRILYSVNVSGWFLVLITLTVFGSIFGTMFYLRTHMRIR